MIDEELPTAEEIDRMFDEGVDLSPYIDWSSARRPGLTGEEPAHMVFDETIILNGPDEIDRGGDDDGGELKPAS